MAKYEQKDSPLDVAKLQTLADPLLLRLRRIRGNVEQPIELPPKEGSPPGANWTRDEILSFENWVLKHWSGGGHYRATIVDARGVELSWSFTFSDYPARMPPNTLEASMGINTPPTPAVVAAAHTPQQVAGPQLPPGVTPLGSSSPTGWPPVPTVLPQPLAPPYPNPTTAMPYPIAPPQQAAQQAQPAPSWPPTPQPAYPWAWPGYQPQQPWQTQTWPWQPTRTRNDEDFQQRNRRHEKDQKDDEEKRELEQKLRAAELLQKEMEYKAQLDRIQQQQAQQIQQLQQQSAVQMTAFQEELRRMTEARAPRGEDEEVRRLREEQTRQREQALIDAAAQRDKAAAERQAFERQIMDAQLAQMRAAGEAQVNALREQLARVAEGLTSNRGESEEYRRIRETQERQERELERARQDSERVRLEQERKLEQERQERERERERYERERRDEMYRAERDRRDEVIAREITDQRKATEQRFEQLIQAQQARASDPVVDMMKETARANTENMREIARMQQASTEKMAQFMVAPAQLAQIMKDNNNGADGVMRGMIQSIGEIGNLYKGAAEAVLQMSGGGGDPPAARLIQEGIGRATEIAERYLAVQRDKVISEGKVKQAEAARDTTKIQAEAHLRATAMQTQARWATPPAVANAPGAPTAQTAQAGGGLGGAGGGAAQARPGPGPGPTLVQQPIQQPVQQPQNGNANGGSTNGQNGNQKKHVGPIDLPVEPTPPTPVGAIDPYHVEPPPVRHSTGPTDEEMFGVALESVYRLRKGIIEGNLTPEKTIDAILQGVERVISANIVIPAFVLFTEGRYADFMDVVLAHAGSQPFKDECVRILTEEVELVKAGDDTEADDAD